YALNASNESITPAFVQVSATPTAPSSKRRSSQLGFFAVGLGDKLHQMTARIIEINAPAAVALVDLAGPLAARGGVVPDAAGADARQRRVELRLADEERVVLRAEILAIGEIERDAVGGADRHEMAPLRAGLQIQDVGEEFGRGPPVPRRDDRVIERDTH